MTCTITFVLLCSKKVCESLKSGIAALIGGTNDEDVENVIRAISFRTQMPFIDTHWKTFHRPPDPYTINLYPDPDLLSQVSTHLFIRPICSELGNRLPRCLPTVFLPYYDIYIYIILILKNNDKLSKINKIVLKINLLM